MAHFAKLGANGKVIQVLTLNNSDMHNADGVEDESVGQQYLETHNNWPAHLWIQTSYNTRNGKYYNTDGTEGDQSKALRGNFTGIGETWDSENQIFWGPKSYPSWVKNIPTASWQSPAGPEPELTAEQQAQNNSLDALWIYEWIEASQVWQLTNRKP